MKYLQKRKDPTTGIELENWQLCVPVPKSLQLKLLRHPATGQVLKNKNGGPYRLFRQSLGTSDKRAAERIARPLVNNLLIQFDELSNENADLDMAQLVRDSVYWPLRKKLDEALSNYARGNEASLIAKRKNDILRFSRELAADDNTSFVLAADNLLRSQGIYFDKESAEYKQLLVLIHKMTIDGLHVHTLAAEGDFEAQPRSQFVRDIIDGRSDKAAKGETFQDLFEQYIQIRIAEGRKRLDGADQDRMVLKRFAEFVGQDRDVSSINSTDVRSFRDNLAKIPKGYTKKKVYAGLTIRQAIEKAQRDGDECISWTTRNRYMSTVSPFFDWLRSEGRIKVQPFDGLHHKAVKGENPRPPFTSDQLNQILSSPLFVGFAANGKEHLSGDLITTDWRYWIPLIGIFTGARVGEIAQLGVDDVRQEFGIWFFHLREDRKLGRKVKSRESRIVPVHSKLVDLGMLTYVANQKERAKKDKNLQLFPEIVADGQKRMGDVPSRFWRDYLEDIGIKTKSDGLGMHSFRHAISDRFRAVGYLNSQFGPLILGHSDPSVTSGYGVLQQGTAQMRSEMIEAIKFDDLDFSKLHTKRALDQALPE